MSDARRQDDRCDFPDRLKPRARLWGSRHSEQLEPALGVSGRSLSAARSRSCRSDEDWILPAGPHERIAHATAASDDWSGGSRRSASNLLTRTRGIRVIREDVRLNSALWEMAIARAA